MAWGPPGRPGNRGKRTRMSEASAVITPDKFHDECAVVGVYGHKEAANLAYLSLYALQHRGQESSGIVSNDGEQFHWEKGMGLVADVFTKDRLRRLSGRSAIGHNRYSTAGSRHLKHAWVVASETCAFDLIGAETVRDIEPGELILLDDKGLHSFHPFPKVKPAMCIFEHIYFARPDSKIYGNNVYSARKALGRQLAKESHVPADIVIAVPDSGMPAALGYAEGAHIPFELGLIRNHYVGRTFIAPEQRIRHFGAKVKLHAVPAVLEGKRVVVVDHSTVH